MSHGVKNISLGYGVRASLMLFFLCVLEPSLQEMEEMFSSIWALHISQYLDVPLSTE